MNLKLFKVTVYISEERNKTNEIIVIAGNEIEAKRIVNEEYWTISGMIVKSVKKIEMEYPTIIGILMEE